MVRDGSYKPAIQVNREYRDYMRFTADGVTEEENKWFPKGTQTSRSTGNPKFLEDLAKNEHGNLAKVT